MAAVLDYAMDQTYTSSRGALLAEFRNRAKIQRLIEHGVLERVTVRHAAALRGGAVPF